MFITVSIGNTNTVMGLFDGQKPLVFRKQTDSIRSSADFDSLLDTMIAKFSLNKVKIEGSILSSVVPGVTEFCTNSLINITGEAPFLVHAEMNTGINFSRYTGLLGSDRIAVCAAAWERFKTSFIVIDMGTATTFNVVDKNGNFLGGAILPGLRMGLEALNKNTAQLPNMNLEGSLEVIGHNTRECLLSGAYYGTAAMVDGLIKRMIDSLSQDAKVMITGGNASALLPFIKTNLIYDPDLLLHGLAVIYNKNYG